MQGLYFIRGREPWKMFIEELDILKIERGGGAINLGNSWYIKKKKSKPMLSVAKNLSYTDMSALLGCDSLMHLRGRRTDGLSDPAVV